MNCQHEWAFDVDFDVLCGLRCGHVGEHYAEIAGNGGVVARIRWSS